MTDPEWDDNVDEVLNNCCPISLWLNDWNVYLIFVDINDDNIKFIS